jgi:hypothetical protein
VKQLGSWSNDGDREVAWQPLLGVNGDNHHVSRVLLPAEAVICLFYVRSIVVLSWQWLNL